MKQYVIAVDFDHTIATEEYPAIGELIEGAKETMNWMYDLEHTVVIWTSRVEVYAEDARYWLDRHNIKYHYFNESCPKRIEKYGQDPRKIGYDIIIDDKCIFSKMVSDIVDWELVREALETIFEYGE